MPHFRIETNLPRSRIPKDFICKAVPIVANTLGKPEELCVVSVIPDVLMSFGGSSEACGIANFQSIGKLGIEENKKHAAVLYELVEKELGIPPDSSSLWEIDTLEGVVYGVLFFQNRNVTIVILWQHCYFTPCFLKHGEARDILIWSQDVYNISKFSRQRHWLQ